MAAQIIPFPARLELERRDALSMIRKIRDNVPGRHEPVVAGPVVDLAAARRLRNRRLRAERRAVAQRDRPAARKSDAEIRRDGAAAMRSIIARWEATDAS